MADQSPSKLSPTAGAFMPGAVQIPQTDENGKLEFTRPEFMLQKHEISSLRGNYDGFHGENVVHYQDRGNYGDDYPVADNQYDNGQYGTNYYPEYNDVGSSMYGDNSANNYGSRGYGGDYNKSRGYKNKKKDFKNKPQYSNHSTKYYPAGEQPVNYYSAGEQHAQNYMGGEQPYYASEQISYPCEHKRKALAEGMTLICVGCGAFAKKLQNSVKGHNWTSLSDTVDYSSYMNAPICPHGSAPKKLYGSDRQMGKKFERSEGHAKKQPTHSNKNNNASKQDHETQTVPANGCDNETQTEQTKLSDRDNATQTSLTKENHKAQTPPASAETKPKSRPNSLMISGWSATIPLQLQMVIKNIPALHQDGSYDAHDRIKSAISMFEKFVEEYETVLEENKMLKSQVIDASVEPKENEKLEKKMGEVSVGEVNEKGKKEYLGYSI
ncbi:hypothetical protein E6O75_ATG08201 [Venturia nashicola]|uniref:Uncharacterized protein n=1 Tax=Venturia nashicola TaxID=86259 RepID=A0A4Z1P0D1_9PEZI|nr:hypothetical protein E6O75_ATG08201 [Venturia nashicola]